MVQPSIRKLQEDRRELARNKRDWTVGGEDILEAFCPLTHIK
jgi:hypothetical protein